MSIGKRIEQIIAKKNLKYQDVAKILDISVQYFEKVRKGTAKNVSPAIYRLFCHEYEIHLDWLLTGEGDVARNKLLDEDKENLDKLRKILESDDEGTKKAIRDNVFSFMVSIKRKDILEDLIKKGKLSFEDARLIDADIRTKQPSGLQQPKPNLKQGSAGGQTKNKKAGNDK
jgi:transcriptional regulator with XRE-family HTH domain